MPNRKGQLRVLAHVHLYPPGHNAGAEWMLHAMLLRLRDQHDMDVRVITNRLPRRRDTFEGIPVECVRDPRRQSTFWRETDIGITHLDATRQAMYASVRAHRPLVHVLHNHAQLAYHKVPVERAQLVVANSEWVRDAIQPWPGETMVCIPPVWCDSYPPDPGGPHDAVVLLNRTAEKGALLFYELARLLPHRRFVAVTGSYGVQLDPPEDLSNVEVWPNQVDVTKVYREARVILMPSSYESWGRVAVEAAAAGVPSIVARTLGLLEADVAHAALPVNAEQTHELAGIARARVTGHGHADEWAEQVELLFTDEDVYGVACGAAYFRSIDLQQQAEDQLDDLAGRLRTIAAAR